MSSFLPGSEDIPGIDAGREGAPTAMDTPLAEVMSEAYQKAVGLWGLVEPGATWAWRQTKENPIASALVVAAAIFFLRSVFGMLQIAGAGVVVLVALRSWRS